MEWIDEAGALPDGTIAQAAGVPVLSLRQRLQNRIRMAILHWMGLDAVLSVQHHDLAAIVQAAQHNAQCLEMVVKHLNAQARLMQAWRDGYPILGKIAAEHRASQIKAAKGVLTNGTPSLIVDPLGNHLQSEKPNQPERN